MPDSCPRCGALRRLEPEGACVENPHHWHLAEETAEPPLELPPPSAPTCAYCDREISQPAVIDSEGRWVCAATACKNDARDHDRRLEREARGARRTTSW